MTVCDSLSGGLMSLVEEPGRVALGRPGARGSRVGSFGTWAAGCQAPESVTFSEGWVGSLLVTVNEPTCTVGAAMATKRNGTSRVPPAGTTCGSVSAGSNAKVPVRV